MSALPEIVTHSIDGREVAFECPTDIALHRAKRLYRNEPGTIRWIDSFAAGSVFWDIGANTGAYSLYACVKRNCRVFAFEPSAANYYGLNNNIRRNVLDKRVTALAVALDDRCRFDTMRMRDAEIGTSLHVFAANVDFNGNAFEPAWHQGMLGVSMDALVDLFGLPPPDQVKIDVDGNEMAVLRGGLRTLSRVSSVLVEVNLNQPQEAAEIAVLLQNAGLRETSVKGNLPREDGAVKIFNLIYSRP